MTTKQRGPAKRPGKPTTDKPTIDQENHDQNIGQRDRTADKPGEKPPIGPDKHDNYGQRGTLVADDNDVE
jgi:hypothetical protein